MNIAVITGASSGMGREFARQLCQRQRYDEVWLISRRANRLDELAAALPCPARILPLDLTDSASFDRLGALLASERPRIMTLVNCSGYGIFDSVANTAAEDISGMIRLNCEALALITKLCLPHMPRGSHIFQLDSLSAFQPVPYIGVYAATKAFVLSFSRALAAELRPEGVRVLAVCPGWVATEFFDRARPGGRRSPITYFNKIYDPAVVVRRSIRAMYSSGRDVFIYGPRVRVQTFFVKLLPHRLVMNAWLRQQGLSGAAARACSPDRAPLAGEAEDGSND